MRPGGSQKRAQKGTPKGAEALQALCFSRKYCISELPWVGLQEGLGGAQGDTEGGPKREPRRPPRIPPGAAQEGPRRRPGGPPWRGQRGSCGARQEPPK